MLEEMALCWEGPLGAVKAEERPSWLTKLPGMKIVDWVPPKPSSSAPLDSIIEMHASLRT